MNGLHPVERRGGVRELARPVVEGALAAADAAEIEAQHGEAALLEHVEEVVDDLVVHRPAELRVRMQNDPDRRVAAFAGLEAALEAASRACEDHFGHRIESFRRLLRGKAGASVVARHENLDGKGHLPTLR